MKRLSLAALAALLVAMASTASVSAQQSNEVTAKELTRHGFNMPAENVMLVVISHTGSTWAVDCVIHDDAAGLKENVGEVKPGDTKVAGVNAQQMTGKVWVQCIEQSEGRSFSSNDFSSVGRTLVHFTTGAKFLITQKIVP